jgi:hypothetical protein
MGKFITLIIALAVLSGCANNFEKFYTESPYNPYKNPEASNRIIAPVGNPEIIQGSDNNKLDATRMTEDGYAQIGSSGFHGTGTVTRENLIAQAKKVGAAKVVSYSKYMSSESGTTSLTLPNTQTTYHSGGVSTYGAGGSGYGSYSGTSTTYGTTTTQIPYTRHRYEYGASYWVKMKIATLGASFRNPNSQEKSNTGTNAGVIINATVRGGPAYKADIVPGDLVVSLNNERVHGQDDFLTKIRTFRGQLTNFEILRKGKTLHKKIQLNN